MLCITCEHVFTKDDILIWGGELPEVVVTPNDGGDEGNGNDGGGINWDDNWSPDTEFPDPNTGGGGGGNSNENPTTTPKKISYTASQFKNTGGYVKGSCDCMCMAKKIMKQVLGNNANIGSSANVQQLWKEINGIMTKVGNANDVFNTLNSHLNANHPIIVGVDHTLGKTYNADKTTDHWIVIIGRGYDDSRGQYYYNYVETGKGAGNGVGATSDSNRLYYDSSADIFKTDNRAAQGGRTYTLTQIRPNQ